MLKKTQLYSAHVAADAKMGGFAGYDMPLYYDLGVKKEHEWVRENAGLFDVSHMGHVRLKGAGTQTLLESLTPSSFEKLGINRTKYTVFTNEKGGIVDDLMVTKTGEDDFHLVINAGCKDKDIEWIQSHLPETVELTYYDDRALIALQGPKAEAVLLDVLGLDLSAVPYMGLWYEDDTMLVSRLGYTGEDGFEISVHNDDALSIWEKLVGHEAVEPIGLAARDSLRLDMGYCLYGHDITSETSPVEADLSWVMGKNNTSFIGSDVILPHKDGVAKRRVGVRLTGKGIAREGAEVRSENDEVIGKLTSGGFSPTLGCAIGQAYVPIEYAEAGTKIVVNVRGRNIDAEIARMPFVSPKTKSMKSK